MVEEVVSSNPYSLAISLNTGIPFLSNPWLTYRRFLLFSGLLFIVTHKYISIQPSLLISTTDTPLHHLPSPSTLASFVISSNFSFPLFKYHLLDTILPTK